VGDPLFDALRNLRRDLAADAGVPPYVVYHDAVLRAMAVERPASLGDMGQIPGIGEKKLAAYGSAFMKCIGEN
jgi:ATP-dependent DNA helicase RecQ